jgi:hypothetical protein
VVVQGSVVVVVVVTVPGKVVVVVVVVVVPGSVVVVVVVVVVMQGSVVVVVVVPVPESVVVVVVVVEEVVGELAVAGLAATNRQEKSPQATKTIAERRVNLDRTVVFTSSI